MNKKQRIVVIMAMLSILLLVLFVPYGGKLKQKGDDFERYLGYFPIWSPPTHYEICPAFFTSCEFVSNGHVVYLSSDILAASFSSTIDTDRILLHMVGISAIAVGLFLALKK